MLSTILYIVGFLKTLLFLVFIFLVIRWIKNILAPPKNTKKRPGNPAPTYKEGETTIRFNQNGEKIVDKDKGEYVDFEEVN